MRFHFIPCPSQHAILWESDVLPHMPDTVFISSSRSIDMIHYCVPTTHSATYCLDTRTLPVSPAEHDKHVHVRGIDSLLQHIHTEESTSFTFTPFSELWVSIRAHTVDNESIVLLSKHFNVCYAFVEHCYFLTFVLPQEVRK